MIILLVEERRELGEGCQAHWDMGGKEWGMAVFWINNLIVSVILTDHKSWVFHVNSVSTDFLNSTLCIDIYISVQLFVLLGDDLLVSVNGGRSSAINGDTQASLSLHPLGQGSRDDEEIWWVYKEIVYIL